jgi:predicted NBD/HSP70 family sugar kinase
MNYDAAMSRTFLDVASPAAGLARQQVLVALRDGGPASRAQLARRTGLAPPTITKAVRGLLAEGVVLETGPIAVLDTSAPRSGPRGTNVAINPDLAHVLGIEVGYRTIRVMVCDVSGRVRGQSQARLGLDHTAREGLPVIRTVAEDALARAGVENSRVIGAGVALRGPIDSERQRVSRSAEVGGWAGLTAAEIEDVIGHRVRLENDANLAALGEHTFGAGRNLGSSLTVKFHSGIGLGIIVNGGLVTGLHGAAGELGHLPVDPRGPLCRCGKRGCLDTAAAVPAIIAAAVPRYGPLDLPDLLRRLGEGDIGITRLVQDAAAMVGQALANASLLLAPEKIIVVGAMSRAGEAVLQPIRYAVERETIPGTEARPLVELGELGDHCTPLGAAALALRETSWLAVQGQGPQRPNVTAPR